MKTSTKFLLVSVIVSCLLLEGCLMVGRKAVEKMNGSDQSQQVKSTDNYTD